jgi:drug/metabolite transporter (DMT)-like permease
VDAGAVRRDAEEDPMTAMYPAAEPSRPVVNAGRLWAGGLATAVVAALIAVVGILVGRGLFHVEVLAPKGAGVWGDADTAWYALGAAVCALAATALMHLLLLYTPRPMRFFGWVMTLATVVAMLLPFVTEEDLGSRVFTAGLNFVLGVAIGSLVAGTARTAVQVRAAPRPAPRPYR